MSTATETVLLRALASAAEQAAALLPTLGEWSIVPVNPDEAPGQPAAARAVVTELEGLGRLVVVVAGPLARAVQVGPPPAEDLIDGLTPLVNSVAAVLGATAGVVEEQGADMALIPQYDEQVNAVRLIDGEEHTATLALLCAAAVAQTAEVELPSVEAPQARRATRAADGHPLEMLREVELGVTVELGRTRMLLKDILDLVPGSVIELDRAAGSPVDILVNGTLIARGEVVVIDEEYGVRITEVMNEEKL
jgi:flagellar motor switch protein FliN/FliY